MSEPHLLANHPAIAARLNGGESALRRAVAMIEDGGPSPDKATQRFSIKQAVANKRDHNQAKIRSQTGSS